MNQESHWKIQNSETTRENRYICTKEFHLTVKQDEIMTLAGKLMKKYVE